MWNVCTALSAGLHCAVQKFHNMVCLVPTSELMVSLSHHTCNKLALYAGFHGDKIALKISPWLPNSIIH